MNIKITEEKLKEVLGKAFEAGFHGSKDLKDPVVEDLMSKLPTIKKPHEPNKYIKYVSLEEMSVVNYPHSRELIQSLGRSGPGEMTLEEADRAMAHARGVSARSVGANLAEARREEDAIREVQRTLQGHPRLSTPVNPELTLLEPSQGVIEELASRGSNSSHRNVDPTEWVSHRSWSQDGSEILETRALPARSSTRSPMPTDWVANNGDNDSPVFPDGEDNGTRISER